MKKLFAVLLSLFLLFCAVPVTAFADEENVINIGTVSEWNTFAENCTLDSWSSGKEVRLSKDIDFIGSEFRPVPLFSGYFNGNGHSLLNISLTEDASTFGVFRQILRGAAVENLNVNGSYIPGGTAERIGGIAGNNYGTIRNCSFSGTIEALKSAGGICAVNAGDALIENCTSNGAVSAQHRVGGICGENAGTVSGCTNNGQVNTEAIDEVTPESPKVMLSAEELIDITDIGGIAGISSGVLRACQNAGPVGYPNIGYNIGGITGRQSGFTTGCYNKGKVCGRKDIGGITGQLDPDTAWDFSGSNLARLQGMLGDLQGRINTLVADAEWTGDAVASNVQSLLGSLSGLGNAAASFVTSLENWLQVNIDSSLNLYGETGIFNEEFSEWFISLDPNLGFQTYFDEGTGKWFVSRDALESMFSLSANAGFVSDAPAALFSSLQNIEASLGALGALIGDSPLLYDIQSVSDQTFAVSDFITGMFNTAGTISSYDYVRDISENINDRSVGVITDCSNTASVEAESNAGGIIGAVSIDFNFDQEDELNLSAILSGGAKYLIFAAAQNCISASDVTAEKSAAGGIAGKMDYGALIGCEASGSIVSGGDYAGGISGYSKGTLQGCRSRAGISAERYQGGVAGYGFDLIDCFAMPELKNTAEYSGSIAGSAEGTVSGNYYAESAQGGIDGFSFEGQAQEVSYPDLLSLCPENTIFNTIVLTFIAEEDNVQEVTVPFGGEIKKLPSVPDKDGLKWKWDDFDHSSIYHSMSIGGHYVDQTETLSTGEDIPLFLAEGNFYNGQELTVTPYTKETGLSVSDSQEISAYTAEVKDYDGPIRIRMKAPENGQLYILNQKAGFEQADFERDGSYIVFDLENGNSFAYVFEISDELTAILKKIRLLQFFANLF